MHNQSPASLLLAELVDYAGLFPPAGLDMVEAVGRFAEARRGPHAWMLGRFVVPVSRLAEFDRAWARVPGAPAGPPWELSVLGEGDVEAEATEIAAYAAGAACAAHAAITMLEVKVARDAEVDRAAAAVPPSVRLVCEYPQTLPLEERAAVLGRLRECGAAAKIRTGGTTPDAIPSAEAVAAFVWECLGSGVPFKATAGLHHAVRGEYRLTASPDSPTVLMHGFLNLFLATALTVRLRATGAPRASAVAQIARLLDERGAEPFGFDASGVTWGRVCLPATALADVRRRVALAFGSCSFDEPVDELRRLGLVD
jgi:hypothetical protein